MQRSLQVCLDQGLRLGAGAGLPRFLCGLPVVLQFFLLSRYPGLRRKLLSGQACPDLDDTRELFLQRFDLGPKVFDRLTYSGFSDQDQQHHGPESAADHVEKRQMVVGLPADAPHGQSSAGARNCPFVLIANPQ